LPILGIQVFLPQYFAIVVISGPAKQRLGIRKIFKFAEFGPPWNDEKKIELRVISLQIDRNNGF
jgi:hypothetical protein